MKPGTLTIRYLWSSMLLLALMAITPAHSATCNAVPRLSSSFIEGYIPADWSRADWDTLYSNQKQACIGQLIIQYTAQSDPGNLVVYYPAGKSVTSLGFTAGGSSDEIGDSLTEADKTPYRTSVVVGLQLNETEWFSSAGNGGWLDNQLKISSALARDIFSKYGSHASFSGWYLPFEVDNCQLQTAADVDTFVDHFLGPLAKLLNTISPNAGIYMSPAFDTIPGDGCGDLSAWSAEWHEMFSRLKSNSGKYGHLTVIALQDGVGALLNDPSVLDSWYSVLKGEISSAAFPNALALWANTEVYSDPNNPEPMFLRQVVSDMQREQNYVQSFTSFAWSEFYNPQFVNPAYGASYAQYLATGSVDATPPGSLTHVTASAGLRGSHKISVAWTAASDNVGVVAYVIYRNGSPLQTLYSSGTGGPALQFTDTGLRAGTRYCYTVYALDAAGNRSKASSSTCAMAP